MEHYRQSIRLELSHYMGSAERARRWIRRGKGRSLYKANVVRDWRGYGTWLHMLLHKPLLICGLGLEENEVFLRWSLIERARYFRKFPERRKDAWYAHMDEIDGSGKLFFLEGVGITPVRAGSYDELYGAMTWA